ncbi:hypothetical protein RB195_018261 [Necator americanus]
MKCLICEAKVDEGSSVWRHQSAWDAPMFTSIQIHEHEFTLFHDLWRLADASTQCFYPPGEVEPIYRPLSDERLGWRWDGLEPLNDRAVTKEPPSDCTTSTIC